MSDATSPYALVVDDDSLIREAASDILAEAGFQTLAAADSDNAVAVLAESHASIVLLFTDVQMPGSRDGFGLARYVNGKWPHIAIVVASGNVTPGPGDMPDAARFIGKPFSAEMVHAHLQEILPDGRKPEPLKGV